MYILDLEPAWHIDFTAQTRRTLSAVIPVLYSPPSEDIDAFLNICNWFRSPIRDGGKYQYVRASQCFVHIL